MSAPRVLLIVQTVLMTVPSPQRDALASKYFKVSKQTAWVGQSEDLVQLARTVERLLAPEQQRILDSLSTELSDVERQIAEIESTALIDENRRETEHAAAMGTEPQLRTEARWAEVPSSLSIHRNNLKNDIVDQREAMVGHAVWSADTDEDSGPMVRLIEQVVLPGHNARLDLTMSLKASRRAYEKPTVKIAFGNEWFQPGVKLEVFHTDRVQGKGLSKELESALLMRRPLWGFMRSQSFGSYFARYFLTLVSFTLYFLALLNFFQPDRPKSAILVAIVSNILTVICLIWSRLNEAAFPGFEVEDRNGRSGSRRLWLTVSFLLIAVATFLLSFLRK